MNVALLKQWHHSLVVTALLAGALSITACQPKQETEPSLEESISEEQAVPMSAEPAEPSDVVVDAPASEVADDTVATVNTGVNQMTYLCSPELEVEATYKDNNQVVLATAKGTVTLTKTNEASNPEVFEGATASDGTTGFVQWRVAHQDRETGVMRTAGTDTSNVTTYECKKTQ
ncbi:hypothetical protein FQ082_06535 [Psychrobacter sp. ANT_H56B]|uniref:hypothetical protein n=1 Tax=Psychrobacter sp. ANT_H56B TaxID=2597353 RepID=UPI0011F27B82|nr:hypothetical protein [Psychrobacter sp. ANT_H56B]KAA0927492.1 hypothetical protein FQ082_06535 [Psychrobacter sp. ANT_H56B]